MEGITETIPEVISQMEVKGQKVALEHAGHLLDEDSLWHRLDQSSQKRATVTSEEVPPSEA